VIILIIVHGLIIYILLVHMNYYIILYWCIFL